MYIFFFLYCVLFLLILLECMEQKNKDKMREYVSGIDLMHSCDSDMA